MMRVVLMGWAVLLTFVIGGSAALAEPKPLKAPAQRKEVVVCSRPPAVPSAFDVWAVLGSGKVVFDNPLFFRNLPTDAVLHVFRPGDPACRKVHEAESRAGGTAAPAPAPKVVPSTKVLPSAVKAAAAARRKKETEEHEANEREAKKARAQKEAEAVKQARPRREKQAQADEEERHRQREREPKVLPREGVTARWRQNVLPAGKEQGVTTQWPTRVLPLATAARCGLSPAKGSQLPNARDIAASMRARPRLLKELVAFEKAKSAADKEASRQKLRELFESIPAGAAQRFQTQLAGKKDDLAVTFRALLEGDSVYKELRAILEKKYMPTPCAPPAQAPPSAAAQAPLSPAAQEPASLAGVTLPSLSDEQALDALHKMIGQAADELVAEADNLTHKDTAVQRILFKANTGSVLHDRLAVSLKAREKVAQMTDAAEKARWLNVICNVYVGLLNAVVIWHGELSLTLVVDWAADGNRMASEVEKAPLKQYAEDMLPLLQASLDGKADKMTNALPAAIKRYHYWMAFREQWAASIRKSSALTTKVLLATNIAFLAMSAYQVWRTPAVMGGGQSTLPPFTALVPGGLAAGSRVSAASLAGVLESIRHLIKIGALNGGLIEGLGTMVGGGGLPELQQPTSLSVQQPNQPGSSSAGSGSGSSTPQTQTAQGGAGGKLEVAERVSGQLADSRLGPLAGKISAERLQSLATNPNAMRFLDTATGHTNVVQLVEGRLLRITIADGKRIISVGPIQKTGLSNGIANGRFVPIIK